MDEIVAEAKKHMDSTVDHFVSELAGLRTGRASVHLLDQVKVDYYGSEVPINQLATIATPDATLITVVPFDPTSIAEIEKAIHKSGLDLNPTSDGKVVRLPVPRSPKSAARTSPSWSPGWPRKQKPPSVTAAAMPTTR